jgi:glycerol-3-phosphate acyltransferase PlsY
MLAAGRWLTPTLLLALVAMAGFVAVSAWLIYPGELLLPIFLTLLGAMVVWRHRANIARLIAGKENRIEFGKKRAS